MSDHLSSEGGAGDDETILRALNRRVNSLRVANPVIGTIDVDLLFLAYLLETARFGLFSYGPITIDLPTVEARYMASLKPPTEGETHRLDESRNRFYDRLGTELERAGARRPNELHLLLAFMRVNEGLPAAVFGELGVRPEAVQAFARQQAAGATGGSEFLSPEEVARKLDVNVQTVRAWIRSGKLPASRLAGRRILRVRDSDLAAILEPVDPNDFD